MIEALKYMGPYFGLVIGYIICIAFIVFKLKKESKK